MIFRKGDKIAFLHRENTSWMPKHWAVPAGKVEDGETFEECAVRESMEEVGVKVNPKDLKLALLCHRNALDGDFTWVDVWFEVTKWEGELYNAEPDVNSDINWLTMSDLPENTVPTHKYCLEQIVAGKVYAEHGWPKP